MADKSKKRAEPLYLRVVKGALVPANAYTESRLREKGYRIGDILTVTLSKLRSNGYNRYAHRLATMVAANIECFAGMAAHRVLKRLQIESGVACEITAIKVPGYGLMEHRTPLSFSFDGMDEGEFREAVKGLCIHLEREYWPTMTSEQIEAMIEIMPDET